MEELTNSALQSETWEFFHFLYPELYRYVARTTGAEPSDVEDLVSETLLEAWRDRGSFRGDASSVTWAISIARHRVSHWRRKAKLRERSEEVLRAVSKMDSELVPEDLFQEMETKRAVRRALESLPEPYGKILIERYLEGKTVREIATQGHETEEAAESRLRRARETFRDCLLRSASHDGI